MICPSVTAALARFTDIADDRGVEARYPKVTWSRNPRVRAMQRKCYLIAEYYRANPEAEAPIVAQNRRYDATTSGFSEHGRRLDDGWNGIERTAPPSLRATLGPQLTHGAKRGLPVEA